MLELAGARGAAPPPASPTRARRRPSASAWSARATASLRVRADIRGVADLGVPVLLRGERARARSWWPGPSTPPARGAPVRSWASTWARSRPPLPPPSCSAPCAAPSPARSSQQEGYFRRAHGGTLFLDEIGEAPPEVQVMLLRALETGEIFPVGGQAPQRVGRADRRRHRRGPGRQRMRAGRLPGAAPPPALRLRDLAAAALRERREDIGRLLPPLPAPGAGARSGEGHRLDARGARLRAALAAPPAWSRAWPATTGRATCASSATWRASWSSAAAACPVWRSDPRSNGSCGAMPGGGSGERLPDPPRRSRHAAPPLRGERGRAPGRPARPAAGTSRRPPTGAGHLAHLALCPDRQELPASARPRDLSAEEIARCFHECGGDVDAMVERLEVSGRRSAAGSGR